MRRRRLLIGCLALSLAGCERGLHETYNQPKYKPLTPTELFADGNSSRPQVRGTVARSAGALAGSSSGREDDVSLPATAGPVMGVDAAGGPLAPGTEPVYVNPLPVTSALLARGRERFDIYCAPCHSIAGDGDGMIARRGFPAPPSYHTDRLRNAADSHFYQVITNGYGVMYPYADRIAPQDRWAIVAYIRALERSRQATVADVPAEHRQDLEGTR